MHSTCLLTVPVGGVVQVIYSLNTKNEEQEATLQSLRRIATETQGSLQPAAEGEEGEEFALRTRLLELQAFVEEEQRKGELAQAEFEIFRLQVRTTPDADADCLKHTCAQCGLPSFFKCPAASFLQNILTVCFLLLTCIFPNYISKSVLCIVGFTVVFVYCDS